MNKFKVGDLVRANIKAAKEYGFTVSRPGTVWKITKINQRFLHGGNYIDAAIIAVPENYDKYIIDEQNRNDFRSLDIYKGGIFTVATDAFDLLIPKESRVPKWL